jgi:hypothetical protein
MRCVPSGHRSLSLSALALLVLPLLSGCGFGTSQASFVAEANRACEQSATRIANMHRPDGPPAATGYAIDLFAQKDRLLISLNEMDLPARDSTALRDGWLRPATRDLARARPGLVRIHRAAMSADSARLTDELAALARADTAGVDDTLLSRYGLTDCLRIFGDPTEPVPVS